MIKNKNEFQKFATKHLGINSLSLDKFQKAHDTYLSPMIIEERQLNVAQIDIYSRLIMDRILFLGVPIEDDVANIINAQLLFLESTDPTKEITMFISSPGGYVDDGLSIVDTMEYISSPVYTTCTGMAASMAAIILACGEKGHRKALKHSRILIHQPMGGTYGQASEMEIAVNEINKSKKELYNILSEKTGQEYDKILKDADRDFWMTSPEAKEYGLIDEVLLKRK